MPKAYWISTYRAINDADKMAAYAALAKPALRAPAARSSPPACPPRSMSSAMNERVTLIEWDSAEQAIAAHDGDAYQRRRLAALGDGGRGRDIRIVDGV